MARLILSLKGRELDKFLLGKGKVVIGRSPECDIRIDNPAISRHHAEIGPEGNGYVLRDLGSSNGTFINGEALSGDVRLKPGDVVGLAKFELQFQESPRAEIEKLIGSADMDTTMMVDSEKMAAAFYSTPDALPTTSGPKKLVVLKGDASVKELPIERDVITIGKDKSCDIVIKGLFLDKIEATLTEKGGRYFLNPLGGGIRINDSKISRETALKSGDTVTIGKTVIAFT